MLVIDPKKASVAAILALITGVYAESHIVTFENNCGFGTPLLVQNGNDLSTGAGYTANGPLIDVIAFLQTGACGPEGEGCTAVEATLQNPPSESIASMLIQSPYVFSVTTGFAFYGDDGQCDGIGLDCISASDCTILPSGTQRTCNASNIDLAITFCD